MPAHADLHDLAIPQDVLERIRSFHRPLLLAHINPDADALGSLLGLSLALRVRGAKPIVPMPAGSISQKLQPIAEIYGRAFEPPEEEEEADGIIVLDTARESRANCHPKLDHLARSRCIVNIDHHSSNTRFGQLHWIVPAASSTSELAYRLSRALNAWPKATETERTRMADLFYAGIVSDTMGFSLSNTTAGSLHCAAELVQYGAKPADLGRMLLRSATPAEFALIQTIYDHTRVIAEGKIAYSRASLAEIHAAGCSPADVDSQVDVPRSVAGIKLAMLFTQTRGGQTRINFRGEHGFKVLPLAQQFGGGGHDEAAGASLEGDFEANVAKVLTAAEQMVKNG